MILVNIIILSICVSRKYFLTFRLQPSPTFKYFLDVKVFVFHHFRPVLPADSERKSVITKLVSNVFKISFYRDHFKKKMFPQQTDQKLKNYLVKKTNFRHPMFFPIIQLRIYILSQLIMVFSRYPEKYQRNTFSMVHVDAVNESRD